MYLLIVTGIFKRLKVNRLISSGTLYEYLAYCDNYTFDKSNVPVDVTRSLLTWRNETCDIVAGQEIDKCELGYRTW